MVRTTGGSTEQWLPILVRLDQRTNWLEKRIKEAQGMNNCEAQAVFFFFWNLVVLTLDPLLEGCQALGDGVR